jgi:alkaline phosphatase D
LNNTEASFVTDGGVSVDQRKMNAVRAYYEWMPIRQVDMDDNLRIWRTFSIGKLFDLVMLDTRHYDRSITDLYWNTDYVHEISNDGGRSMMGSRQELWFYNQLIQSYKRGATWRIIGSQTGEFPMKTLREFLTRSSVFSRLNESLAYGDEDPLDYDAWDGYQANKNRTLKTLYDNNIPNNIMLSGDSHAVSSQRSVWKKKS